MSSPVAKVASNPLQYISSHTKVNQLVKYNFSVGSIESAFKINKCYNTAWRKASLELHRAVVRSPLGQKAIQSGREFGQHAKHQATEKNPFKSLTKAGGKGYGSKLASTRFWYGYNSA